MTSSDKLLVVHTQDRVVRVQELGVEDDLDPVVLLVEQLGPPDLVQDRIVGIILHVVGRDRGQRVPLERKHSTLEQDLVLVRQQALGVRDLGSEFSIVSSGVLEQSVSDPVLDLLNCVLQLLDDGLTLKGLDRVRVGSSGHDDERDNGGLGTHLLQSVVQTCGDRMTSVIASYTRNPTNKPDSRAKLSRNMSTPLFLYSYLPAVNM